ncbi:SDR family NAD(P)-dependent oxidoreductase [Rhodococcus coprophilus]|uniref:Short chain dehydrogenase n=1 Tax=Rhodococcus coprophilus TaxID=38310 RepID=A0A2X4U890_9NOCA|nr:SDR family NAD(P)-dependent oxidoreductase [Rhodococcus coprophilus]MBM7459442.1 NAD(P)-dependent dehydrogenase (short-subunit alcohol dehydrogenase family) [Rhodococcus coprophilus]SQI36057.1 short chain dehydrogenase [Rhodococcus coprophilus]
MKTSPMHAPVPNPALEGGTAIVTGAGQGIGRGIALALAAAGAQVAVVGRTAAPIEAVAGEIVDRGGVARPFVCDVTDAAAVERLVPAVAEQFGGITVLVNNAQTAAPGSLLELDEATYREAMESGPTATWRLMRACHPYLQGHGSIVNLGSAAGIRWNPSGTGGYAAAKEAIRVLTRTAACEWAGDGIRVNAILPLADSKPMQDWARADPDAAAGYLSTVPLGRLGDPETDIGPAVVFLCSDAARYITGHALPVDGGQALVR